MMLLFIFTAFKVDIPKKIANTSFEENNFFSFKIIIEYIMNFILKKIKIHEIIKYISYCFFIFYENQRCLREIFISFLLIKQSKKFLSLLRRKIKKQENSRYEINFILWINFTRCSGKEARIRISEFFFKKIKET